MFSEEFLRRLSKEIKAPRTTKARIRAGIMHSLNEECGFLSLESIKKRDSSLVKTKNRIWEKVYARISAPQAVSAFGRIKVLLTPSEFLKKDSSFHLSLKNIPQVLPAVWPQRFVKLTATFALLAIAVRMTPFLFLPSHTVADSSVMLLPTRGEVSISIGGLWQPVTEEVVLAPGTMFRTHAGEASILFHDDGVIRLAENTTVEILDTEDRSKPSSLNSSPTISILTGKVWVQGLIPSHVSGITVSASHGMVTVNEGSVLIKEDNIVDIAVYNRRAVVSYENNDIVLVAGERTQIWEGNVPLIKKIQDSRYEEGWEKQNLERDAVHRKEIAQLQQERRASRAGILPTSALYPVKRVAEKVDVLLTFGSEAKTQKRIDQAECRLDEAAALLSENQDQDAEQYITEYIDALIALSDGTSEEGFTDLLLQNSLITSSTDIAAALPDDNSYLLKLAVLEASVALGNNKNSYELEAILLMDSLTSINQLIKKEEWQVAYDNWIKIQSSLDLFKQQEDLLPVDVRKETIALLESFAQIAKENEQGFAGIDADFVNQVVVYLPVDSKTSDTVSILSEEEISSVVSGIRERIFVYHMQRSRLNQLISELKALEGHPEEGRVLRRLYTELPYGPENFPERIQKEITRLRWEKAVEI
ncbi:MAG: FecR domain-containing protein [Candidatus Peribacteraceae bacterium]|nr:FecR domain-containing protein [Candidatus Peribacteraceae bacterium]